MLKAVCVALFVATLVPGSAQFPSTAEPFAFIHPLYRHQTEVATMKTICSVASSLQSLAAYPQVNPVAMAAGYHFSGVRQGLGRRVIHLRFPRSVSKVDSRLYSMSDSTAHDSPQQRDVLSTGKEFTSIRNAEERASSRGLEVLDRRGGILVINKPSGIRMNGNFEVTVEKLVNSLPGVEEDARFPHRLDFGTSGVLLCCLSKEAAQWARAMFDSKQVRKTYLALVEGTLEEEVTVDAPISEFQGSGPTMAPNGRRDAYSADFRMMVDAAGKPSQSRIVPLEWGTYMGRPCTKVVLEPMTGRRHQLRLHTLHAGHPILGDWTYGDKELAEKGQRMMLHAWKLGVPNCPLRLKRGGWVSSGEGDASGLLLRRKEGGFVLEGVEELEAEGGLERWAFVAPDPFAKEGDEYRPAA